MAKDLKSAKAMITKEIKSIKFPGALKSGSGHYKSKMKALFWWRIEFTPAVRALLKKEFRQFEGLHLTPYFVGRDTVSALADAKADVFGTKAELPNIDPVSGNIHPAWRSDLWIENPRILQAVLVRRHSGSGCWGPAGYRLNAGNGALFTSGSCYEQYFPQPDSEPGEHTVKEIILGIMKQVTDESKLPELMKLLDP